MLVDDIRLKFGDPVSCDDAKVPVAGEYCVLGAAIMYRRNADPKKTTLNLRFPNAITASKELGISYNSATTIADLADAKEFGAAWYALDLALQGHGLIGGSDNDDFNYAL